VYEQVTNKLSARFVDIGARKVKNIPEPVHAYVVATWDNARSYGAPQVSAAPASTKPANGVLSFALIGVIALCAAASAFLLVTQRPDGKAAISQTTAAALPPAPASPPPTSSSSPTTSSPPETSTPVPAIRRTNNARNESEITRRSFQSCSNLATQRGWGSYEARGKTEFIAACTRGEVD
jgi:hypothetical protein